MKREAEPFLRPKKRHEAAEPFLRPKKRHEAAEPFLGHKMRQEAKNFKDALAALERLGSIYFLKTLPQTAIPALSPHNNAYLSLPAQFVRENAHKVEEWVILRIPSNCGRLSRPWTVRLSVIISSAVTTIVRFAGGWKHFVADNGLKKGDSLIFVLKEGVRSEFEVHVFRGLERNPYFLDLRASSTALDDDDDEEEEEEDDDDEQNFIPNSEEEEESFADDSDDDYKQSCVRSCVRRRDARSRASTGHGRDDKAAPEQQTKHSNNDKGFPGFRKVLSVTNISRRYVGSARKHAQKHSGDFEFPRDFVRTHGEHLRKSVQLQGVHKDSPVFVLLCHICKQDGHMRVRLHLPEWNRFVTANRLMVGQELQFSMTADSYFKVRVI